MACPLPSLSHIDTDQFHVNMADPHSKMKQVLEFATNEKKELVFEKMNLQEMKENKMKYAAAIIASEYLKERFEELKKEKSQLTIQLFESKKEIQKLQKQLSEFKNLVQEIRDHNKSRWLKYEKQDNELRELRANYQEAVKANNGYRSAINDVRMIGRLPDSPMEVKDETRIYGGKKPLVDHRAEKENVSKKS